jgi:hypothetical protein
MNSTFPSVRFERQCGEHVPQWLYWTTITINGYAIGTIGKNNLCPDDDYTLTITDHQHGRTHTRHSSHHETVADAKAAFFALPFAVLSGLVSGGPNMD